MKKKYNIIILVLSIDKEPWRTLENNGIRKTWLTENNDDVKVIFYYGDSKKETQLIGDKLFINEKEGLYNIGKKTLKAFDFINENFEYNYLFRTNSSSYIDINMLNDFTQDKPKHRYYDGTFGKVGNFEFCSGCGYFLSNDLVKLVLDNKGSWKHDLIDDVALGKLMNKLNVKIHKKVKRFNYTKKTKTPPTNFFHYRCKIEGNRTLDVKAMKKIHELKCKD